MNKISDFLNLKNICTFGVAGNFTGHLEEAGEAKFFENEKTEADNEPKAIFPTYICALPENKNVPDFLKIFPFSSEKLVYPENEKKIQLESECAVLFKVTYECSKISSLFPVSFAASNDCSIRKDGKVKISIKKNWGNFSKGVSSNFIKIDSFSENGILKNYAIASYLVRNNIAFEYGENSAVNDYSYIYEKLINYLVKQFNFQNNQGPKEEILKYLEEAGFPDKILVSIGATRYTEFGKTNFLQKGDYACVILYPQNKYSPEEIKLLVEKKDFSDSSISALYQKIE